LSFKNDEDVWDIVHKLIKETREVNKEMGKSFDIASSVASQISFFACKNIFLSSECQQDISKYTYCKDFSVPAYKGTYGEQPNRWVQKSLIIKNALVKRDNRLHKKQMDAQG